ELRPEVPAELAELVERMLAKRPEARPQLPAEVARALLPFCRATERGEKVEYNTAPTVTAKPPGWSVPPPTLPARPEAGLEETAATNETRRPRPREEGAIARKPRAPAVAPAARRRWPLVLGIALFGLAVGVVALWASGVFDGKTG